MKRPEIDELTYQGPVEGSSPPTHLGGEFSPTQVSTDPLVGTAIGDFRILKKLGVGGMGVVYEGLAKTGQRVAIKVLKPEFALDTEYVRRLMNEARAVASLQHPGIVEVLSVGTLSSGRPYVVMEYLAGQSVEEWAAEHSPLPIEAVRSLGAQICSILAAVHAKGIVHRDLKGDNMVWVIPVQGPPRLKLLDFGVAKISEPSGRIIETHSTKMVGTPAVMSPEQIRAEPISPRTDLYSLGAVLYRLLTGVYPFESQSMAEVLLKHLNDLPIDPRTHRAEVPEPLARLVLRLLEKAPSDRPESAAVVEQLLNGGPELATSVVPALISGPGIADGEDLPTSMVPLLATTTPHAAGPPLATTAPHSTAAPLAPLPAEPPRPNPFSDLDQGQSDIINQTTQGTAPVAIPVAEAGPVPDPPGPSEQPSIPFPGPRDTFDSDRDSKLGPGSARPTDRQSLGFAGPFLWLLLPVGVGLAAVIAVAAWVTSPWRSGATSPTPPPIAVAPRPPVAPAPVPVVPAPTPKPVARTVTSKQLLSRIDGLKAGLKKRRSKSQKAPAELKKLRRRAESTTDDAQLLAIANDLDALESQFAGR